MALPKAESYRCAFTLNEKGEVRRRRVPKHEKWNYTGTEELAETKLGQIAEEIFDTVDD